MTRLVLHHGDCVHVLRGYADGSIGAIVSDPPYGLSFMGKDFDKLGEGSAQREWHRNWLTEAYRVLRSGGVIKAFSGSRTFHHLASAMSSAGFTDVSLEAWSYGSGFPKSLNVSKAIDKAAGAKREIIGVHEHRSAFNASGTHQIFAAETTVRPVVFTAPATPAAKAWSGWGTALKPAWEPVVTGRKPA